MLDQAVITDDNGKVILNLAQQDCVAMRVTFRVGFQIANPINDVQSDASKRFPAYVLAPASVSQLAIEDSDTPVVDSADDADDAEAGSKAASKTKGK